MKATIIQMRQDGYRAAHVAKVLGIAEHEVRSVYCSYKNREWHRRKRERTTCN